MRIGKRHKLAIPPPTVGLCSIHWTNELQYLGITFIAGYKLTCNFYRAKARYFGSLNSLFSKLGSSPPKNLVIALSTADCIPMLDYGLEAIDLSKAQVSNLSYVCKSLRLIQDLIRASNTTDTNVLTVVRRKANPQSVLINK